MAYGTKYRFRWESTNGVTFEIQIQKDGYSGNAFLRPLGAAPVLKRKNSGNIYGSSLEIMAQCDVDGEYTELYTSNPLEYRVRLLRGSTVIWVGFVEPELYVEPDIAPPYDVQIIATDGLGELKEHTFTARGNAHPADIFEYILAFTGNAASVCFISSITGQTTASQSVNADQMFRATRINIDYKAGKTCYDVLQYLLDTFHAGIMLYQGLWCVFRETDVAVTSAGSINRTDGSFSNAARSVGKMGTSDSLGSKLWPIGKLSTKVEAALNQVSILAPLYKATPLLNADMTSDSAWLKYGDAYYDSELGAYVIPSTGGSVEQSVAANDMAHILTVNTSVCTAAGDGKGKVMVVFIPTSSGLRFYLYDRGNGLQWYSYDELTPTERDNSGIPATYGQYGVPSSNSLEVPAFYREGYAQSGELIIGFYLPGSYVFDCHLYRPLSKGYRDVLNIDNGARNSASEVEIAIGRESSAMGDYRNFVGGILTSDNALVTGYLSTAFPTQRDYLALMARDYALSVARPRLRVTGKLDTPSTLTVVPFVLRKGGIDYMLETFSWDLYNDEMDIDARSLPAATLTVEGEVVMDITGEASSTSSGSGGGSSSASAAAASAAASYTIDSLVERMDSMESLIGEDEDHNAYVKPYESTARELKNAGGATFRDLNLIPKTTPGSTAHLEVVTINGVPMLHSTLPFYSDGSIIAGGIGNGGGGGTGNAAWVNGYSGSETAESIGLNVGEVTHRLSLYGHKHAISDVFNGIGSATPAQGDTLVYGANGWSYGASGGVSSVAGLTGTITTAQLRTALGLGAAAYRGVASDIAVGGQDLVPSGLLQTWVSVLQNAIGSAVDSAQTYTDGKVGDLADEVANGYVAKVSGKGLSTNDFTNAFKTKLQGIATGAQVNVIETVKVNGTALAVSDKAVDVPVPTALSQLSGDSTHRVVTDAQITTWNNVTGDYVTRTSAQTISGQKTFGAAPLPGGTIESSVSNIALGSPSARWNNVYAANLNITGGVYSSAATLSFYAGGATQVFEGTANYVALQKSTYINGGLYLHGNQSNYGQNIGTASKHWNRVYAQGLYPLADDGVRIVYDSSVAGFRLYGNLIVSGQVVAGQTGSGSSSFPVSVSGSIIPTTGGLNLGSDTSKWGTLYATAVGASGQKVNNIYASTLHVDTLDYTGHIWGYPGLAEYVSSQSDGLTDSDIGMTPAILAGIKAGTVTHIALGPWNGDEPTSNDRAVVSPHLEVNYYGNYVTIYFRYAGSIYRLEQVSAGSTRSWRFRRN